MITAVIIDDEKKNVDMLERLLKDYCPQVSVTGTAHSAATGKSLIGSASPQLVFLDIEMPYGSGFDLLQSLPDLDAEVIFVTAFDQYAINAFRYAALDYLLKPVNIEQLVNAVSRAEKRIAEKDTIHNYNLLLRNLEEKDAMKQSVAVTDKGLQYYISLADIMYIIADGSYTHIHTAARRFVSTRLLKDLETLLPANVFCRIHYGHIVNRHYITKIQRGRGGTVVMKDGQKLEVAIRRKDDFLKMMRS